MVSVVAENVRRIAKEKGIKHTYIASKIGVSPRVLSNLLSGRSCITADQIIPLCVCLDVLPNDLFDCSTKKE